MAKPRLLCFHGKAETGASFVERLGPIGDNADLVCVDAPHPIDDGFAWWMLPPGERSFTTPVFEGWDETLAYVRKLWSEQGPFDGMLGFSQGAILIAALAATGDIPIKGFEYGEGTTPTPLSPPPKVLMLFGAAPPGPFRKELATAVRAASAMEEAVSKEPELTTGEKLACLHVVGAQDKVNPPEGAGEVAAAVGGEVYTHGGAHEIPLDGLALEKYVALLKTAGF
mmetsp:Transcript_15988/g.34602  ORF Transcript_15988/g.34602 Transcript_15988/m.34602 type:complete len:226 (-) Transcript_15988:29-706(-)|eukprot:CAMPEP_0206471692 /NCGR_PEP_ID=MMETSP0324_2-20121206/31726_1 /ASSEMBLY_ACC=CAM_ASM_000836 /TAXON_ID=2866 /ORGANISM="Crypthecodinium cohnii, Strain Seligo" /LENGTH=225 /DNA_ID=CAMNT_0053946089 /DNA_START=175 /DNA_END=852 /DNA_ORIENTATION=-